MLTRDMSTAQAGKTGVDVRSENSVARSFEFTSTRTAHDQDK